MKALLALFGLVAIAVGVGLIHFPAALIVVGLLMLWLAARAEK